MKLLAVPFGTVAAVVTLMHFSCYNAITGALVMLVAAGALIKALE